MHRPIILLLFLVVYSNVSAQTELSTKSKKAIELYTMADNYRVRRQFTEAIRLLNEAIEKDKNFVEAYHRLGLTYFAMNQFKKALANYEKGLSLTTELRKQKVFWYDMGEPYLLSGEYDKAMKVTSAFINTETQSKTRIDRATRVFRSAEFAMNNRVADSAFNVRPLNDTVNRFVLQYFPVLTADQMQLIFTRREGSGPNDDEDLVVSNKDDQGRWKAPVSISANINTRLNEGTSTISADGRKLIFTSCAGRDGVGSCDLYETVKIGNDWTVPKNLGRNVNSVEWESQPSLSADGRKLYFVSDRRTGLGQRDIWVSTLDDNGQWTKAVNVGKPVNSPYDEMSPFIHANNRTLFFATNGLPGFGGYDIFFSEKDSSSWTPPKNIGGPINDHQDQYSLFITADGLKGYYSHEETLESGLSTSKIIEATIPMENQLKYRSNYVKGIIRDRLTKEPLAAKIELVNIGNNAVESLVESDAVTGEYLMVLTQGAEYALYVNKTAYLFKSYYFNYSKVTNFEPIIINIDLDKANIGSLAVLNNIFFEINRYELKEKSVPELKKVIRFLQENPALRVEISGHTDNVGSLEYNLKLSDNRALSVYNYLVLNGIDKKRLSFKGYGPSRPVASNTTESDRQLNRRIEFKIIQ